MVGKTFTYLLGSDAASLLFNSKNEDLNAEDVYSRLTTPVFGKGVAYDVPNPVCGLCRKSGACVKVLISFVLYFGLMLQGLGSLAVPALLKDW